MKNQFWAIRTDHGRFCQWTLSYTRRDAIHKFEHGTGNLKRVWKYYRIKKGFRCVKVKLIAVNK